MNGIDLRFRTDTCPNISTVGKQKSLLRLRRRRKDCDGIIFSELTLAILLAENVGDTPKIYGHTRIFLRTSYKLIFNSLDIFLTEKLTPNYPECY